VSALDADANPEKPNGVSSRHIKCDDAETSTPSRECGMWEPYTGRGDSISPASGGGNSTGDKRAGESRMHR
jgi:hypothetical protein